MKNTKEFKRRAWQEEANQKDNFETGEHIISSCNATIGSGKTVLPGDKFAKFILMFHKFVTVQFFVVPWNSLFDQQVIAIKEHLRDVYGMISDDPEDGGTDYHIHRINCENHTFDRKNNHLNGHNIFFINEKSLWGKDSKAEDPEFRWHLWLRNFKNWDRDGARFGECFLDEAHNYHHNVAKIFDPSILK